MLAAACSGEAVFVAPVTTAWTLPATITFAPDGTFDLSLLLPAGLVRGGHFTVSPNGKPLPTGASLSPTGVLSATMAGTAAGVIFGYDEP